MSSRLNAHTGRAVLMFALGPDKDGVSQLGLHSQRFDPCSEDVPCTSETRSLPLGLSD